MLKLLLPAGMIFAALPFQALEAGRCPAGQMYRVSLEKCAPRGSNLQYLKKATYETRASVERPQNAVSRLPPMPPRRGSLMANESQDPTSYAQAPALSETPLSLKAGDLFLPPAWPYGALR